MSPSRASCLLLPAFLFLLADVHGNITITQTFSMKNVGDGNYMVSCKDEVGGSAITWKSPKGDILGPSTRPEVWVAPAGYRIVFKKPLRVDDSGNYTCSTEKEKRVFQLIVEPPLQFTDTDANQTAVEGDLQFVLKCEVTRGTVTWTLEGGDVVEPSSKFKVIADGLVIRNVTRHDSKTYICKGVQQKTGTVLDRKIHLHVKHKPVHPNHPQKHMRQDVVYAYINGSVNLTCVALANPPAKFEWKVTDNTTKKGQVINESPEVSILQLHIDSRASFGNYKCVARNKYGSYEENFTLKEGTKPLVPAEVVLKDTESKKTTFEIVGPERTPEMDLDTKGFRVLYKKVDEKEWRHADFNVTTSNLYTLEGLEPSSDYEMQAATRNAAGLSDYFTPMSWQTTSSAAAVHPAVLLLFGVVLAAW